MWKWIIFILLCVVVYFGYSAMKPDDLCSISVKKMLNEKNESGFPDLNFKCSSIVNETKILEVVQNGTI